jgi:hypothetical protein
MAVSSDVGNKLIAWLMAGAGTLLAYSAYRNRAPWDVLRDIQGEPAFATSAVGGSGPQGFMSGGGGANFQSAIPRLRMIANREIPPELVPIQPSGKLDRDAAASLARIHSRVGAIVPNVGSYRSFGEQAAAAARGEIMADGNPRFGSPNKSLHVVGLAIDVRADYAAKPEVIAAFTEEGWHRARPSVEPWHWSYGVRG